MVLRSHQVKALVRVSVEDELEAKLRRKKRQGLGSAEKRRLWKILRGVMGCREGSQSMLRMEIGWEGGRTVCVRVCLGQGLGGAMSSWE